MTCKEAATRYVKLGFSPIPIQKGSKKPACESWKEYQSRQVTEGEIGEYWRNGAGVGVVCGYGNLEVMDFDEDGFYERWHDLLPSDIQDLLTVFQTPSGCYHVYYKTESPSGNSILARLANKATAIETRGAGGYVVAFPTQGYTIVKGSLTKLPMLTDEQKSVMWAVARSLNEHWEEVACQSSNLNTNRVGDQFNDNATWEAILEAHGWKRGHRRGENTHWTRYGKDSGTSATTNDRHLYVFSSNAPPFEPGRSYTKFAAYTLLNHKGDFHFAAQTLGAAKTKQTRQYDETVYAAATSSEPRRLKTFDNMEAKSVDWLIEPYFPIGFVTMLFGDSGIGKSTSMYAIASMLSQGKNPVGGDLEPVRSVILSAEDPAEHVILPRLRDLGARLDFIAAPDETGPDGEPSPLRLDVQGCAELSEMVREFGAKLLVIDPLRAYFDGDNMDNQLQARSFMRRLNEMAHQLQIAVVIVHHVNKNTQTKGRYRASGSQDFFDACRSALMAGQDPNDQEHFALIHEKHNLSPKGDAIGYTFDKDTTPAFRFTGATELCSDDLTHETTSKRVSPQRVAEVASWLLDTLEEHGEMLCGDVYKLGSQLGYEKDEIFKANRKVKSQIQSIKHYAEGKRGVQEWSWRLRQFSRHEGGI